MPDTMTPPAVGLHGDASLVLEVLHHHRLLTAEQVHAMVLPEHGLRWAQTLLLVLHRRGLAGRVKRHGRDRTLLWYATPLGTEAAISAAAFGARRFVMTPAKALGPAALHTLAANEVGLALMEHAARAGHEFGPFSWEHEVWLATGRKGKGAACVADLSLSYLVESGPALHHLHRLVEVERGNQQPVELLTKVHRYVDALEHGAWRDRWPTFPPVLFVFAPGGQQRPERALDRLVRLLVDDERLEGSSLRVQATTLERLQTAGPFAPICEDPDTSHDVPLFVL